MATPDTELISILGTDSASPSDTAITRAANKLPDNLPILGVSDVVIFPGMVAPLLVESDESTKLIDDVVEGDRLLGLVLQKKPELQNPAPEDLHKFGCAARVLKMLKFPDNTIRILIEGVWRIRITSYTSEKPYLRAKFEVLRDTSIESVEVTALARLASQRFREIIKLSPTMPDQVKVAAMNTEKPGPLADLIAANLNLTLQDRQHLLESRNIQERLDYLRPLLDRELEVVQLGSKIQNDVTSSMAKSQRDFFLREQIRAIQRELGEGDPVAGEVAALRKQLDENPLPEEPQKVAMKEIDRLSQMSPAVAEYTISRNYLDWLLNLPWNKTTADTLDLRRAEKVLDDQHYGLGKVKERLLDYLAVIKLKHDLKGPILCLVGPPGVGKTSLGKSVADALGRKFIRIALGGLRDEAEIRGHRRTYVGAMPGRIIQALRRVETRNPVVLLDELDKVGSDYRGDPAAALLEVLDPEQNNTFTDHYLDVPFDLSQVLFITTANWLDPIHAALRDRLEMIRLPSYTAAEKLQIAKRHLIPRQLEEHGLKRSGVKFPDVTLRKLIQEYTHEAGVRQLERAIGTLSRKAARRIVSSRHSKGAWVLKPQDLKKYLGHAEFTQDTAEKITEAGIAMGLAWTPVGGEILFIEATRMPGKGSLILTGSLGDVMKESAQT
ncbi:MAG TPA: endopeptidase La, partial [Candidatus Acidoferrum sp.]|nr:endopeptidase La [Candidatus Acidoferrum sp.]